MSAAEETTRLLASLEARKETGCLTIESAGGLVCHAYLLVGKVFHAEGPAGEGQAALNDALSWPDVALSFDEKGQLPSRQTITEGTSSEPVAGAVSIGQATVNRLSDDPRLSVMGCASLGGGCLLFLVPVTLAVLAGLLHADPAVSNGFSTAAVIAVPTLLVVWLALHVGFRVTFYRDAVTVPGMGPPAEIPRVVEALAGVISGQTELVLKMQTRCSIGKLGDCSIEFYADGLQVLRDPQDPGARWQFSYRDLLHAESVDLVSTGTRGGSVHQNFVRVIIDQPRMVFLFGSNFWWLQNQKAQLMVNKLREHQVLTFAESIDT